MKTDKELLELAAKAAGIKNCGYIPSGIGTGKNGPVLTSIWNPLTDDGDALRLAVKLRLDIVSCETYISVWAEGIEDCDESYGNNPYAATRRAIVRAAAAIGEKL